MVHLLSGHNLLVYKFSHAVAKFWIGQIKHLDGDLFARKCSGSINCSAKALAKLLCKHIVVVKLHILLINDFEKLLSFLTELINDVLLNSFKYGIRSSRII